MVIANTSDGSSCSFDISDPTEFHKLRKLIQTGQVTALSLLHEGMRCCLPPPKKFKKRPLYGIESITDKNYGVIGEKIFSQADDIRVNLTLTFNSKFIRCDLVRIGSMRYSPTRF